MKDALGEHIHSFFLKKKRDEWHKFESTITEWEIKHYRRTPNRAGLFQYD